jgi:hypothetical protein
MHDYDVYRELLRLLQLLIARLDVLQPAVPQQPALPPGRWLNTKEAAERIGCNRVVLRRWCFVWMDKKCLPGVRRDPRSQAACPLYQIHESVVEDWRKGHRGGNGDGNGGAA